MEFLMCLQKKDFRRAQGYQRELTKLVPRDRTIAEFSKFLPDEIAFQDEQEAYHGKDEDIGLGDDEYYDEEDDEEWPDDSSEEDGSDSPEEKDENEADKVEGDAQGKQEGDAEEEKTDSEYGSEYDDNGRKIWGEEGVDFEWYHKEDKENYVEGEAYHAYPEDLLNKHQVDDDETELQFEFDRKKMYMDVKAKMDNVKTSSVYKIPKKPRRLGGGFNLPAKKTEDL